VRVPVGLPVHVLEQCVHLAELHDQMSILRVAMLRVPLGLGNRSRCAGQCSNRADTQLKCVC
jgi:hypothetical protein